MAPVGVSGVGISPDDVRRNRQRSGGFCGAIFLDVVGGRGIIFASPVNGDQGRLVVGVKGGADVYGCGGEEVSFFLRADWKV